MLKIHEFIADLKQTNLSAIPDLKQIAPYHTPAYTIKEIFNKGLQRFFILDVRSEKEFAESHLMNAVNFPILNNDERGIVGTLYKSYSHKGALKVALEFGEDKKEELRCFLKKQPSNPILLYCWRGGGRSRYVAHELRKMGFDVFRLKGGYKAYRKEVVERLYSDLHQDNFLVLSGMTGVGKSELLKHMAKEFPVLDLESAASHASSVFGHIRFKLLHSPEVKSQKQFEDRIFADFIRKTSFSNCPYLVENESKRVGKFHIPESLFERIRQSPKINIAADMDDRIRRIKRDYFGEYNQGAKDMIGALKLLKIRLGNKIIQDLIGKIESGRIDAFVEYMITQYYDKMYRDSRAAKGITINTSNFNQAVDELREYLLNRIC